MDGKFIDELNTKFQKLVSSDFKSFDEVAKMKNIMGVYMIFDGNEDIIYIGKTNKFHIRFGTDLKHETTHTLVRKLIRDERYVDRFAVKDFLIHTCRIKIEVCDSNRQAEALEHIAIYILNPQLNK